MGGKLPVYNLGELGVNITKSPIHHADGELLSAQNAEFNNESGVGGLRKRPGLQALNSVALDGAIRGVITVPLPGPGRRALFARAGEYLAATAGWLKSTNGTIFADAAEFPVIAATGSQGSAYDNIQPIRRAVHLLGQFFYPMTDAVTNTVNVIFGFNGDVPYEVLRYPNSFYALTLAPHRGHVIVAELSNLTYSRVWEWDPIGGETTPIGGPLTAGEEVWSGVSWLGKLWIGSVNASTGKIYGARSGDTTWGTADHTAAANRYGYTSLATYQGNLYAATAALAGTAATIEKRTPAGVWSTVRTGSDAVNGNAFDGLVVFQNELYAIYGNFTGVGVGASIAEVHKFNGTTWSIDKDLGAAHAFFVNGILAVGQSLFVATTREDVAGGVGIYRKNSGTWARTYTFATNVLGVI